ncbi:MAG: carbohydrate porin [Gammaproteobacteria bacterium]|nr:carbohydrate porin [Gammaproteobacteria bacterium]
MAVSIGLAAPFYAQAHEGKDDRKESNTVLAGNVTDTAAGREEHHDMNAESGHRLHPMHSVGEATISGWLLAIAQSTSGTSNDSSQGTMSADVFYESTLDEKSKFLVHFDVSQGDQGNLNMPALLAGPNGDPTGVNNDNEDFMSSQVQAVEIYYETMLGDDKWTLTLGEISPTSYLDANSYANDEHTQFLGNQFDNNTALEFGGTANFYGPGLRLTYSPVEWLDVTALSIDANGDYVDMFDKTFQAVEIDLKPTLLGRPGNYRIYGWRNQQAHFSNFLTETGGAITDTSDPNYVPITKISDDNTGVGVSLDQQVSDNVGVWLRWGSQDKNVAQFDQTVSAGLQISGGAFNRADDVIGIAYGMTTLSDAYKATNAALGSDEQMMEAYYNFAVTKTFTVTPDWQYITNPGGDTTQDAFSVMGVRAAVMF